MVRAHRRWPTIVADAPGRRSHVELGGRGSAGNQGIVFLRLKPRRSAAAADEVIQELRPQLARSRRSASSS